MNPAALPTAKVGAACAVLVLVGVLLIILSLASTSIRKNDDIGNLFFIIIAAIGGIISALSLVPLAVCMIQTYRKG
jgi:hypothetical protein